MRIIRMISEQGERVGMPLSSSNERCRWRYHRHRDDDGDDSEDDGR